MTWFSPALAATSTNRENGGVVLSERKKAPELIGTKAEASATGIVRNKLRRVHFVDLCEIIAASVAPSSTAQRRLFESRRAGDVANCYFRWLTG